MYSHHSPTVNPQWGFKPNMRFASRSLIVFSSASDAIYARHTFPLSCHLTECFQVGNYINKDENSFDAVIYLTSRIDNAFYFNLSVIKETLKSKSIPLIVVSKSVNSENKKQLLRCGADDCHSEIIDTEKFLKWIENLKKIKIQLLKYKADPEEKKCKLVSTQKRLFDIVFSSLTLLALSPLMILIAVLIKLESRGPVFYISKRAGSGYQVFNFLKFRTMTHDAEKQLDSYKHMNQYTKDAQNVFVKIKNDPRVTRFGGILRKTSLDELPQLINVLKGDMSIVGNRPLPLYEAKFLTRDDYAMRFIAPAGITGLWQVTKRGKDDMSNEERIQLDIEYASKSSFYYDLTLISKTFPAMIQKENV